MPIQDVKFNLWLVLAALTMLFVSITGVLYSDQSKTKEKQQEINQRVTKLETQYTFIIRGLDKLTVVMEKSAENLNKLQQNKGDKK